MTSVAQDYHEKTKYAPQTLGQGHEIDWAHPPHQFKYYAGAPAVNLLPYHPLEAQRQAGKTTDALDKLAGFHADADFVDLFDRADRDD